MESLHRKLGVIFIGTVLVRILFHAFTGFTADDAFITFRYADNIAAGLGFAYNVGQPVQGSTTPLFTLIMALASAVRAPLPAAALFVSLIASGLTAVIIYRYATLLRFTTWAFVPVLCYALWPRSLPADTCGMETALFTLLVTAAFYYHRNRDDIYAIGMATLSTVTRPEGFIVLGLLMIVNWWRRKERWATYLFIPAMIVGPWLVFSYWYFGSVIPQSVVGKLALYSTWGQKSFWESIVFLMGWHNPFGWAMTVLAVPGTWWLVRKQNLGWLEVVWVLALTLFYATSKTAIFFWYFVPVYPVYLLLLGAAVPWVFDTIELAAFKANWWRPVVAIGLTGVLLVGCYTPLMYYRNYQQILERVHRAIGYYLAVHAHPDDIVAAEDIGYLGYYSHSRILDRDGLISPESAPYNRSGDYLQLIVDHRPDWVVGAENSPLTPFLLDSTFLSSYSIEARFAEGGAVYNVYSSRNVSQTGENAAE